jgi:hypothetical protein
MAGTLGVLDRDRIEMSNLNRSPLFRVSHVLEHSHKVDVVRSYLEKRGVEVELLRGSWASLAEAVMAGGFERWISLTNEEGAWAQVPFLLPPTVLHATTTSGWGLERADMSRESTIALCVGCPDPKPDFVADVPKARSSRSTRRPYERRFRFCQLLQLLFWPPNCPSHARRTKCYCRTTPPPISV